MKWSFEGKWIASVFGLALLLMGTISIVSYRNASQLIESTKQVTRTQALLEHLTDIAGTLADAESGRRGYILFNDESELQRYYAAIQSLAHQIKQLQHRIADSDQQQRLLRLDSLIKQHIALLKQSIDLYQSNSIVNSTQAVLSTQSKRKWDEIQQALAQMESREEQLLERWVKQYQISIRYSMLLEVLGTCLSFVILCGVYALLYRQVRKRQKAENLQQTLKQEKTLNELKLRFFSMVSHEFRTPLSIILGSAQLFRVSASTGV
jgi:CHASE3 domain sensor protein